MAVFSVNEHENIYIAGPKSSDWLRYCMKAACKFYHSFHFLRTHGII